MLRHQRHATGQQKQHGKPHPFVHGFAIEPPGQHGGEEGFQSQHERGTGATGALQAPSQRDRANDGPKRRHRHDARQVGAAQARLALGRLAHHQRHRSRACVEQCRRRKGTQPLPKVLHKGRAQPKQRSG